MVICEKNHENEKIVKIVATQNFEISTHQRTCLYFFGCLNLEESRSGDKKNNIFRIFFNLDRNSPILNVFVVKFHSTLKNFPDE